MNCRSTAGPYLDVARELPVPAALSDRVNWSSQPAGIPQTFLTGFRNTIVGREPPRATPNSKRRKYLRANSFSGSQAFGESLLEPLIIRIVLSDNHTREPLYNTA
jgi:hypothetical protein